MPRATHRHRAGSSATPASSRRTSRKASTALRSACPITASRPCSMVCSSGGQPEPPSSFPASGRHIGGLKGAMNFPPLRLNPALDPQRFAAAYARDRFIQIPDFFEPEAAEAIEDVLRRHMAWRLVFAVPGRGVVQLAQADLTAMGRAGIEAQLKEVMTLATRNIGYCYSGYPMIEAAVQGLDPSHPIHNVTHFLNSPAFLEFGEAVIGYQGLTKVDAQAPLSTKGTFLTRHIDEGARKERRAAYT